MITLTDCPQGSQAWHLARATRFCASEAAAAMGVSKYLSRTELLKQKATGIAEEVSAGKQRLFDAGHKSDRSGICGYAGGDRRRCGGQLHQQKGIQGHPGPLGGIEIRHRKFCPLL